MGKKRRAEEPQEEPQVRQGKKGKTRSVHASELTLRELEDRERDLHERLREARWSREKLRTEPPVQNRIAWQREVTRSNNVVHKAETLYNEARNELDRRRGTQSSGTGVGPAVASSSSAGTANAAAASAAAANAAANAAAVALASTPGLAAGLGAVPGLAPGLAGIPGLGAPPPPPPGGGMVLPALSPALSGLGAAPGLPVGLGLDASAWLRQNGLPS